MSGQKYGGTPQWGGWQFGLIVVCGGTSLYESEKNDGHYRVGKKRSLQVVFLSRILLTIGTTWFTTPSKNVNTVVTTFIMAARSTMMINVYITIRYKTSSRYNCTADILKKKEKNSIKCNIRWMALKL
jgi:hypothetical protein